MSTNNSSPRPLDDVKHSDPIPIGQMRGRARSVSSASSGSASSGYELPTPISGSLGSNNIRTSIPSPTSSPIFSYFMSSPTKTSSTFPLRRKFPGTTPVFEGSPNLKFGHSKSLHTCTEDEEDEKEIPAAAHMRRTSTQIASRFTEPKNTPLPEPRLERGTGLLRRLSLSTAPFTKVGISNPVFFIAEADGGIRATILLTPHHLPALHLTQLLIQGLPTLLLSINLVVQQPSVTTPGAPGVLHLLWAKEYSRDILTASNWDPLLHSRTSITIDVALYPAYISSL